MGINVLVYVILLKKLNNGDYDGVVNEFLKWDYVSGQVVFGLI